MHLQVIIQQILTPLEPRQSATRHPRSSRAGSLKPTRIAGRRRGGHLSAVTESWLARHLRALRRIVSAFALVVVSAADALAAPQAQQFSDENGRRFRALIDTGIVRAARQRATSEPTREADVVLLGNAHASVRDFRAAIAVYSEGLKLHPRSAPLLRWRGHRRLSVRDFVGAAFDLERGIEVDPGEYGLWFHLGVVMYMQGRYSEAADAFSTALPLAPNPNERAGSTDWLWVSLRRLGLDDSARVLVQRLPDSVAADYPYLRRLRMYRGEIAPEDLVTASDTSATSRATLFFGLGTYLELQGDTAAARAAYQSAVKDADGWPAFGFIGAETALLRGAPLRIGAPAAGCRVQPSAMAPSTFRVHLASAFKSAAANPEEVRFREHVALVIQDAARVLRTRLTGNADLVSNGDSVLTPDDLGGGIELIFRRGAPARYRYTSEPFARLRAIRLVADAIEVAQREGTLAFPWSPDDSRSEWRAELHFASQGFGFDEFDLHAGVWAPVFSLRFNAIPKTLEPIFRSMRVEFPRDQLFANAIGSLQLSFLVDASDRVVPRAVFEMWPAAQPRQFGPTAEHYEAFRDAAVRSIALGKPLARRLGGCPVVTWIQQPFEFQRR